MILYSDAVEPTLHPDDPPPLAKVDDRKAARRYAREHPTADGWVFAEHYDRDGMRHGFDFWRIVNGIATSASASDVKPAFFAAQERRRRATPKRHCATCQCGALAL